MENRITGIHHITVIAGDAQKNYEFYTGLLGLRFIKKTVNFDSPDVYHLYYSDETGSPGTILTFFIYPDARRSRRGSGEISSIKFSIAPSSIDYWIDRLSAKGIDVNYSDKRFGDEYITLFDPDGMKIELVADNSSIDLPGWSTGIIPREHSIKKFYGAAFSLFDTPKSIELLDHVMKLDFISKENKIIRFQAGEGVNRAFVDIVEDKHAPANSGTGFVHHLAWRTKDINSQSIWRENISAAGFNVTEIIDRCYFKSIYFREPGGILFEIATDGPGFSVDEEFDNLGSSLKLPPWYEERRDYIESILPPLSTK